MSSWFSPKTEKRTSPIQGRGLFARRAISAGEVVAVKGGAIMEAAAFALVRDHVSPAEIQIEDDLYIAPRTAAEVEASILCLNHSCRPNVGVRGQITFVAMHDIAAGATPATSRAISRNGSGSTVDERPDSSTQYPARMRSTRVRPLLQSYQR